jgi:Polyketide cyclase / dehydrase and lipid transport
MLSKGLRFIIIFIVIMLTALSAELLFAYLKSRDRVLHVEASTTIKASQTRVVEIYQDYRNWPNLFPTIKAVRLVREEPHKKVLEIDHSEGRVINILTIVSPQEVVLEEFKKKYDGKFVNRFEVVPDGTRFTVAADISLKGFYKLLAPFLDDYIRRQITVFVLNPVKKSAEAQSKEIGG